MLAAGRADAIALIDAATGAMVRYDELAARVATAAAALAAHAAGGVAFLFCKNDVATVVDYLAALTAGVPVVLLDARLADAGWSVIRFHHAAAWEPRLDAYPRLFGAATVAPGPPPSPAAPATVAPTRLDLDLFEPGWHAAMQALADAGLTITGGEEVMQGGRVIDQYLATVTRGAVSLRLVDLDAATGARVARAPLALERAPAGTSLQQLAGRFLPGVGHGARAALTFHCLQCRDDARLQARQVAAHAGHIAVAVKRLAHGVLIARWPMSWRYCAPSKWTPRATS